MVLVSSGVRLSEVCRNFEQKAYDLLVQQLPYNFTYHNIQHTFSVVRAMADMFEISPDVESSDNFACMGIIAAAWHDTGYIVRYPNNEECAVDLFSDFCIKSTLQIEVAQVEEICEAILETNLSKDPITPLGKLLRDADLSSLGDRDFITTSNNLRVEWEQREDFCMNGTAKDYRKWRDQQYSFLLNHKWLTSEGEKLFGGIHKQNIIDFKHYWGMGGK